MASQLFRMHGYTMQLRCFASVAAQNLTLVTNTSMTISRAAGRISYHSSSIQPAAERSASSTTAPNSPSRRSKVPAHKYREHLASTNTNSSANPVPEGWTRDRTRKKRKLALLLGYLGTNFSGLQQQCGSGLRTVDDAVLKALAAANLIDSLNAAHASKNGWSRSSRTDKGVHAAGVIVAAKLLLRPTDDINDLPAQINAHLPPDVRVLGVYPPSVGSFCARKSCSLRRYEYLVPAHLLQPAAATAVSSEASNTMTAAADGNSSTAPFVSDQISRSTLADFIQSFVGEHWFHNYTTPSERSKTRVNDRAHRSIKYLTSEVIEVDNQQFVKFTLAGSAFMFHQIRYMIGVIVAVHRGVLPPQIISQSLDRNMFLQSPFPLAPGEFLTQTFISDAFPNWRDKDGKPFISVDDAGLSAVERWKQQHVYPEIARLSRSEKGVQEIDKFLDSLKLFHTTGAEVMVTSRRHAGYANESEGLAPVTAETPRPLLVHQAWTRERLSALKAGGVDQRAAGLGDVSDDDISDAAASGDDAEDGDHDGDSEANDSSSVHVQLEGPAR